jgi:hypothetical protein
MIFNAEKAFELLTKEVVSHRHIEIGRLLYNAYKENGNFKKANAILEQTMAFEKKLYNAEEIKASAFSEIKRKEKSVELAEAKRDKMNTIITFVIFIIGDLFRKCVLYLF